jgi:hypothetical protein
LGLFPRLLILLQLFLTSREISKSYMSVLCDQAFTGRWRLERHLKEQHSDFSYKCTVCKKLFNRRNL